MKKILLNATHKEELRTAIVVNGKLFDFDVEFQYRPQLRSNIYLAKVIRLEPSLEAVFVDYGSQRQGFLPLKEISPLSVVNDDIKSYKDIKPDHQIIIQIEKEERGSKGAALNTNICLAGRYLVYMPTKEGISGISRKADRDKRDELKAIIEQINIKEGGVIIRTAGLEATKNMLKQDLDYMVSAWEMIKNQAKEKTPPCLLYKEGSLTRKIIRDMLTSDVEEILVDDHSIWQEMYNYAQKIAPELKNRIQHYKEETPLFSKHKLESQIQSIFQREILLKSGGSIVIDPTEALVSIDINSSKFTKGSDIEETAVQINLEACEEITKQLKLRDIGGLVVIDFIDMTKEENRKRVENEFKRQLVGDKAKIRVGEISSFGLLELARQRLGSSIFELTNRVCPRCHGAGKFPQLEALSIMIMRLIEEEALNEDTDLIQADVPVNIAAYILNEKKQNFTIIENSHNIRIAILPNQDLVTPNFKISKLTKDRKNSTVFEYAESKNTMVTNKDTTNIKTLGKEKPVVNEESVFNYNKNKQKSFLRKIFDVLFKTSIKTNNNSKNRKGNNNNNKKRNNNRNSNYRNSNYRNNNNNNRNQKNLQKPNRQQKNKEVNSSIYKTSYNPVINIDSNQYKTQIVNSIDINSINKYHNNKPVTKVEKDFVERNENDSNNHLKNNEVNNDRSLHVNKVQPISIEKPKKVEISRPKVHDNQNNSQVTTKTQEAPQVKKNTDKSK